jgi:hypothetical protein
MREGHALAIGQKQRPNNIHHRTAHAAGTELRLCENDQLWLALGQGVDSKETQISDESSSEVC